MPQFSIGKQMKELGGCLESTAQIGLNLSQKTLNFVLLQTHLKPLLISNLQLR
jgi:hypothetical protein